MEPSYDCPTDSNTALTNVCEYIVYNEYEEFIKTKQKRAKQNREHVWGTACHIRVGYSLYWAKDCIK